MISALESYYREHGIGAAGFACKHQKACSGGYPEFTGPKAAYVGPEYEKGTLPRLLFLSLDSGSGRSDPAERTLAAVRGRELARGVTKLNKGRHWYRTHELAWTILSEFDPSLQVETVAPHFAHTNSAKCCQNKPHRKRADRTLFENCRGFIPGELRILKPQILVTQGEKARAAVTGEFAEVDAQEMDLLVPELRVITVFGDGSTLWIPTHHPRQYGKFYDQYMLEWGSFADAARNFIRHGSFRDLK